MRASVIPLKLPNGTRALLHLRGPKAAGDEPEAWLEFDLREGLVAALRILQTAEDELVVAEVRIFPGHERRDPGRWKLQPLAASSPVIPPGGIPARILREVSIPSALLATRKVLREFREGWRRLGVDPYGDSGPFAGHFTEHAAKEPKRSGPGRPPVSERELAEAARRYVRLLSKGSRSPTRDLANELDLAYSTAAERVGRARVAGLLTGTIGGRRGGALTPKAKALLGVDRRRKR